MESELTVPSCQQAAPLKIVLLLIPVHKQKAVRVSLYWQCTIVH